MVSSYDAGAPTPIQKLSMYRETLCADVTAQQTLLVDGVGLLFLLDAILAQGKALSETEGQKQYVATATTIGEGGKFFLRVPTVFDITKA